LLCWHRYMSIPSL